MSGNPTVSAWLPSGALGTHATSSVNRTVAAWSRHWLASSGARLVPLPANAELVRQKGLHHCWLQAGEFAALGWSTDGLLAFATEMVGGGRGSTPLRPADRSILEGLGNRALDDLLDQLLGAALIDANEALRSLGKSVAANESDWRWWRLGIDRQPALIMLGLSQSLCTRIARQSLPEVSQPTLAAVGVGLARQSIQIESRIGCSALKLDEVSDLAVGDVVLLDRPIDELFDLTVAGKETQHKCSLNQSDDRTVLCVAGSKPIGGE